jgi:hypothetical protein
MTACALMVLEGTMTAATLRRRAGIREDREDEALRRMRRRRSLVGVTVLRDGDYVRLAPLGEPTSAGVTVAPRTPSDIALLRAARDTGPTDRRALERLVGRRCDWMLKRLTREGLLTAVGDLERIGTPNVYAITPGGQRLLAELETT